MMSQQRFVSLAIVSLTIGIAVRSGASDATRDESNCSEVDCGMSLDLPDRVRVEVFGPVDGIDQIPNCRGRLLRRWEQDFLAFLRLPQSYDERGLRGDWPDTVLLRAITNIELPAGQYQLLARSRGHCRLRIDGAELLATPPQKSRANAHHVVDPVPKVPFVGMRPHWMNDSEAIADFVSEGGMHQIEFEAIVGGPKYRVELGETVVAIARAGEMFYVVGDHQYVPLTDFGWSELVARQEVTYDAIDRELRRKNAASRSPYWDDRHRIAIKQLVRRIDRRSIDEIVGTRIANAQRDVTARPVVDDLTFLRRLYLDTVGVPPTLDEIELFLADDVAVRRTRCIDRLLADSRWADHQVGYWQDVLAENPNLLKPTLNNTGPFRWWIYEAYRDNRPLDRFASELIEMRGSRWGGGPAGFAMASENDVPMAAKAHVIGSALLGVNFQCARCHDAPYHRWQQADLFHMAAMLQREPITLPETSTVPAAFFDGDHDSLIEVNLQPGDTVAPEWPFKQIDGVPTFLWPQDQSHGDAPGEVHVTGEMVNGEKLPAARLANGDPDKDQPTETVQPDHDTRTELAVRITSSRRFAEVMANRIWQRLVGRGVVEPIDDWDGHTPSDPELLDTLADELITARYDVKAFTRLILTSRYYQREAVDQIDSDWFLGPYRRRMSAEQIVDSAVHRVGKSLDVGPLTLDHEGTYPRKTFLHFGTPRRAWELTTLANERDRPSLAMPRAQRVTDLLQAFGWRNARPGPLSYRQQAPNLVQPGLLAHGWLMTSLSRLCDASDVTHMALDATSADQLVTDLFLRFLTRYPTDEERTLYLATLEHGFDERVVPQSEWGDSVADERLRYVSWSNHLNAEANRIKLQLEDRVRRGPPPTRYLVPAWREGLEDAVWSLLNCPESVFVP